MKELTRYIKSDFYTLKSTLKDDKYKITSGSHSIKELRKAIQNNNPAFINYKGNSLLLVGEDENFFIVHNGKEKKLFPDKTLNKSFNGDAIIVYSKESDIEESKTDMFIYSPYDDFFDNIQFKENLKSRLKRLKLGESFLPPHPVVLKFVQDDNKRSSLNGIEITIHNSFNSIDELFYRLGNIYYNTCLNDEDKKKLKILFKKNKNTENPIFTDKRYLENEISFFSCLYTWYLKSKYIDSGYLKILNHYENEALNFIESVFMRQSFNESVNRDFEGFENNFNSWMEKAKHKFYKINSKLIKVKTPHKIPESIILPCIKTKVIHKNDNHTWHLVKQGKLKDKVLITKGQMIDTDYMDKRVNEILVKADRYKESIFNKIRNLPGIRQLAES